MGANHSSCLEENCCFEMCDSGRKRYCTECHRALDIDFSHYYCRECLLNVLLSEDNKGYYHYNPHSLL
jgi:hypothetical protein